MFGSLHFASTLPSNRSKFQPRAKARFFIEYLHEIKGYKVYDIRSKSFFVSRDLVFHEHIFPFQSISHSSDLVDCFPDLVLPIPTSDSLSFNLLASSSQSDLPATSNTDDIQLNSTPLKPLVIQSPLLFPKNHLDPADLLSYLRDFHCNLLTNNPQSFDHLPYSVQ